MKRGEPAKIRVAKFLVKQTRSGAKGWMYEDAPEQRQKSKVVHPMSAVLWSLELALTSNQKTLRDARRR